MGICNRCAGHSSAISPFDSRSSRLQSLGAPTRTFPETRYSFTEEWANLTCGPYPSAALKSRPISAMKVEICVSIGFSVPRISERIPAVSAGVSYSLSSGSMASMIVTRLETDYSNLS